MIKWRRRSKVGVDDLVREVVLRQYHMWHGGSKCEVTENKAGYTAIQSWTVGQEQ